MATQDKELDDYIKTQRTLGVHTESIKKSLLDAGYEHHEFHHLLKKHEKVKPTSQEIRAERKAAESSTASTKITASHVLWLNLIVVIAFGGMFAYLTYDYNQKIAALEAGQEEQITSVQQEINAQSKTLSTKLSGMESSLSQEMDTTKAKIDMISSEVDRKMQDYHLQSMNRDSALSESIQKASSASSSELSTFSQELLTAPISNL